MQWPRPLSFRMMHLAVMMNRDHLMSHVSQDEVMMGEPRLTVPPAALNDCFRRLGNNMRELMILVFHYKIGAFFLIDSSTIL